MEIYTITMFENFDITKNYTRCVGFFLDLEEAKKAVKNNQCDINECCYNYAVIEKISEGIYSPNYDRWFYEYDLSNNQYVEMEEPEPFKGIYNFSIG